MQTIIYKLVKPNRPANHFQANRLANPMDNQNGSVLVLTLMITAIIAIIAVASSDMVVTENFIMRNVGIHKENVNLVESALMVGLQRFMQIPDNDPDNFDPNTSPIDWINDRNTAWTTATWWGRMAPGKFRCTSSSPGGPSFTAKAPSSV